MIFASLNSLKCPCQYPVAIETALQWIRDHDVARMDTGTYELQGRELYINIQDITTQSAELCCPERHDEYLDIQYVASGVERMGYAPYTGRETVVREVPDHDITLYQNIEHENFINVSAGSYCIFFSNDIHRPGCAVGESDKVRKAVVKLRQSLV